MTAGSERRARLAQLVVKSNDQARQPTSMAVSLSDLQRNIWVEQRIEPASCAYNSAVALEILGPINPEGWRSALVQAIHQMPALMATYVESAGGIECVGDSGNPISIPVKDLVWSPGGDLRLLAKDFARKPFDLQEERPFRAEILRAASDRWVLLMCAHHIAWDGESLRALLTGLEAGLRVGSVHPQPRVRPSGSAELTPEERTLRLARAATLYAAIEPDAGPILANGSDEAGRDVLGDPEFLALEVEKGTIDDVEALARRLGCSPFHVFLAGLASTAFFQGQTGMYATVLHQTRDGAAAYGLRRLLVSLPTPDGLLFEGLVKRCRDSFVDALELSDLSESDLRDAFKAATGRSDFPLGRNLVSFDVASDGPMKIGGLQVRLHVAQPTFARASFGMSIVATRAGLLLRIEAKPRDGVARYLGEFGQRFLADLSRLLRCSDHKLADFPLAYMTEQRRLVADLTGPAVAAASSVTLLLEEASRRHAADPAILMNSATTSYAELRLQAHAWCLRISEVTGGQPRPRIALVARRHSQTVAALWGIWMAGGVAVLLEPSLEKQRLETYLAQASLAAAAGPDDCDLRERMKEYAIPWLALETATPSPPTLSPIAANASGDPAYEILTSGSTGAPKVVQISHGNLSHTLAAALSFSHSLERPSCLWSASLAFDIALIEILLPLSLGGVLHVHGAEPIDVGELAREAQRCDIFHAVPSVLRQVLKACPDDTGPRLTLVGGDKVTPDLLTDIRTTWPQTRIRVLYGPTETTIICASVEVSAGAGFDAPVIGRAHCNTRLRIVDRQGKSVPYGVPGELLVGGAIVGRYTIAEPDQHERFFQIGARRYFRTGDIVRVRRDGVLVFLGRCDDQEKIDGVRVMPEFVEATLRKFDEFEEIAVVGYDAAPDVRRLMAFYRSYGAAIPEPFNLWARVAGRLPRAAFPAHFEPVAELPLNSNGKIDRKALSTRARQIAGQAAPIIHITEMQAMIIAAWSDVLGKAVSPGDVSFMALGGDSLAMARLRVRLQERFQASVSLAELMERPTVAGMAELISRRPVDAAMPGGQPPTSAPLTLQQRQIWTLAKRLPSGPHMVVPLAVTLSRTCDWRLLRQAVLGCLAAHDGLAAEIVDDDEGQPSMLRRSPEAIAQLLDFKVKESDSDITTQRVLERFFKAGFNLDREVLVRFLFVERSDLPILAINVHHVICDGWSIDLMLRDIVRRYEMLTDPSAITVLSAPSFLKYALDLATAERSPRARSYREHLDGTGGVAVTLFDPQSAGRARASFIVSHAVHTLKAFDGQALDALARRTATTPFALGLAAFAAVLSELAGVRTPRIALMSANRDAGGVENVIGLVANTLLVDVDTEFAASDPRKYLHAVTRRLAQALRYQDVSIPDLAACVRLLGFDSKAYSSAFQFGFLDEGQVAIKGHTLEMTAVQSPNWWHSGQPEFKLTGYELAMALRRQGNTLSLLATFQVDVFSPPAVTEVLRNLEATLCRYAKATS